MLVIRLEPGLTLRFIRTVHHAASKKPSNKPPSTKDESTRRQAKPPRLTGSILRPSLFNVPQPRLSPQPVKTSMMIRNRTRARENRREKQLLHMQYIRDMREEFKFWERLGVNERPSRKNEAGKGKGVEETGYIEIHNEQLARYNASYELDKLRSAMVVPPEMIKRVELAKKNKARAIQKKAEGRKTAKGIPPAIESATTERVGP
ncbi:hypothetical protein FFLO_02176 [Filobasidium floriforme]|uniref:Uncharacterized protein n=1 Tax=Filobasidium floriforme TaxID=5210 RepID=A0A8K0NRK8_9TREE|nr:uncharacterized protein HD553DRAFT_176593 [Filobasidium floriforme]KAG7562396.1 hypothetical protein FFLO_02176 [Filobasidium floriforme]KAH8088431.1 hypothetical protein HD553DRAFT_176593 [Filobasidium floriforme]